MRVIIIGLTAILGVLIPYALFGARSQAITTAANGAISGITIPALISNCNDTGQQFGVDTSNSSSADISQHDLQISKWSSLLPHETYVCKLEVTR